MIIPRSAHLSNVMSISENLKSIERKKNIPGGKFHSEKGKKLAGTLWLLLLLPGVR